MRTILLLEDDRNLNRGISLKLEKEGYQVVSAFSVTEAKALIGGYDIQMIISDITLPDGDGMEFCSDVRRGNSSVYIIYLTALDQEVDIINGYDSGADDYMTKPFSLMVLISKVNALMRRLDTDKGKSEQGCLVSGSIEVHLKEAKVYRSGCLVPLSAREYQLLLCLMENAGRIVSKEQILERIWDLDGQFVDENTVAVNISRLKNKLDTTAVSNVRGVGYLWTESVEVR
ncbi:response regulator transcription factor [Blautia schinkii]|nr:response regulator transcription factor [Blautia schinkii]